MKSVARSSATETSTNHNSALSRTYTNRLRAAARGRARQNLNADPNKVTISAMTENFGYN